MIHHVTYANYSPFSKYHHIALLNNDGFFAWIARIDCGGKKRYYVTTKTYYGEPDIDYTQYFDSLKEARDYAIKNCQ